MRDKLITVICILLSCSNIFAQEGDRKPMWYWQCKSEACLLVRGEVKELDGVVELTANDGVKKTIIRYLQHELIVTNNEIFPIGFTDFNYGDIRHLKAKKSLHVYDELTRVDGVWISENAIQNNAAYYIVKHVGIPSLDILKIVTKINENDLDLLKELGVDLRLIQMKESRE